MKYWEIIADNLSKPVGVGAGSTIDSNGRAIWIADAHRERKRFVVRAHQKLTAFEELQAATAGQNPAQAGATAEPYSSLQS
jgi:hypothetical protein